MNKRKRFQDFDKKLIFFRANVNHQKLQHVMREDFTRNVEECKMKENKSNNRIDFFDHQAASSSFKL